MNRRPSIVRRLRSVSSLFLLLSAGAPAGLLAQIAGPNVNMVSGTQWPGGDPFLQRQNEPSLDVSTRNPLHLVAGANDYRTVDIPFDAALPGETNAGDAWLGLFKSLDGGRTWKSTLLPGYPQDISPEGLASPLKGLAAAADATVRAGASGVFLYSGIAFNRGNNAPGVLFVSRFIDNNDKENGDAARGRDPIKYAGTVVVDTGNSGQFLDKPTLAFDVPRPGDAPCTFATPKDGGGTLTQTVPGGRAYLAYTMFVGGTNNINTKLMVASTTDCGATWGQPVKVNSDSHINQGAALAVDPVTGALTVAWRRFAAGSDPNAIAVARSTDGGKTWTVPRLVAQFPSYNDASPATPTLFDQGTTSGSMRTNTYPALAADGTGRLYLAWSQRGVNSNGDARVVLTTSTDGATWSTPLPVDNGLVADDEGGFFTISGRGHQLMPALKFAAGKLMVLYYDLRLDHTVGVFSPVLKPPSPAGLFFTETRQQMGELPGAPASVFTPFLTDAGLTLRRHTIDVRVAQADPGASPAFASARVSRYVYGSRPGSRTIEQLQINPPNLPMFRQGTVPFLGDYIDIAGPPTFVPQAGGAWAWNTAPAKDAVFHAAWTDNRDVRPPANGDWTKYTPVGSTGGTSLYDPTQTKPPCVVGQAGMRNQNIYTAKITQGLVVTTPSNAKQLTTAFPRLFATIVQNLTEKTKSYRLTIANQPAGGTASFLRDAVLTTIDVSLAPRSSASRPVFITSTDPKARVTVNVQEIAAPAGALVTNGLTGSVIFNPDVSNPDVSNPDVSNPDVSNPDVSNVEVYTPDVSNPDVSNPDVSNPDVSNPDVSNPDVSNPDVSNPDVSNIGVATPDVSNPDVSNPDVSNPDVSNTTLTDANYRVVNNGNTAATYRVRLFGDPAGAKVQLILTKVYATPVLVDCTLKEQPQNTLVTNIVHPDFTTNLGTLPDPGTTISDVSNATMTLAPGETGLITLRGNFGAAAMNDLLSQIVPAVVPHGAPWDGRLYFSPLFIPPASLPDAVVGQPYSTAVVAIGGKKPPYVFSIASGGLPAGINLTADGTLAGSVPGALAGTPAGPAGTSTFKVQVADSSSPPRTTTRTLSIRVVEKLALPTISTLPDAVLGQPYSSSIAATGGATPYAFSVSAGSLPAGVTLSGTGTLSGTPSGAPGTSSFTVQIADSTSPTPQKATQPFSLVVAKAPTTTVVTSNANPSVFGQPVALSASVSFTASVTGPPTGTVTFYDNGTAVGTAPLTGGLASVTTSFTSVGSHPITAAFSGDASFATSTSTTFGQTVNQATTTTTVSSSLATPVTGQAVTFTATVAASSPGAGSPSGTVTFYDNGAAIGTAPLTGGTASVTTSFTSVGNHPITVKYGGDTNFAISTSAALAQAVSRAASAMVVNSSAPSAPYGQAVTLTATVSAVAPGAGTPTGVVSFSDAGVSLGTAPLNGGSASIQVSLLPGTHAISASYAGDANFAGASNTFSQGVGKFAPVTSLTASPAVSVWGQPVALAASVGSTAGLGAPTGTITFKDGATVLGTVTLPASGLSTSALAVGGHSITATYGGDANYAAGTSAPVGVTVGKASTRATVTSSLNPSVFGNAVKFTATIAVTAPGTGMPTGSATFFDGATTLGTSSVSGGVATFTTSALAIGPHTITAAYAGSGNFNGSTSAALTQNVYHAAYTFSGFQTPLAAAGTLAAPSYSGTGSYGNAQPVKWQLLDGSGKNVTDLASTTYISAIANSACSGAPNGATTVLYSPTTGAKGGSTFRSGSSGFIFNWDTGVVPGPGCYTLVLQLNDGSAPKATTIRLQ